MPLYIHHDKADPLATEAQLRTGAATKTKAVKTDLRHVIARARRRVPLHARLDSLWARVNALGPADPQFEMKTLSDEMWGD